VDKQHSAIEYQCIIAACELP